MLPREHTVCNNYVKINGKCVAVLFHHAMKTRETGGRIPHIINRGT
jgi:hypothetical protein